MKRSMGLGVVVLMFLGWGCLPRMVTAKEGPPGAIPRSAIVEIRLLKAPGLQIAGSKWEVAYEFRLTNERSLWTEREKFNATSKERVGDLLRQATNKSSLDSPRGQTLRLAIPFTTETLTRLRSQPATRINLNGAATTGEKARLSKEQELKSQVFVFYSVVSVYDSKLKKTLTIPVSRVWGFVDFPDAKFEIRIEINGENSYTVNSSLPKNAKGRQLEIRR